MADFTEARLQQVVAALLSAQTTSLTTAMQAAAAAANKPLEQQMARLETEARDTKLELRALNGKVAEHATRLATGDAVFSEIRKSIERLDTDDRRSQLRRDEDIAKHVAASLVAQSAEKAAKTITFKDSGEERVVRWYHIAIFLGGILATLAVLKFFGRLA